MTHSKMAGSSEQANHKSQTMRPSISPAMISRVYGLHGCSWWPSIKPSCVECLFWPRQRPAINRKLRVLSLSQNSLSHFKAQKSDTARGPFYHVLGTVLERLGGDLIEFPVSSWLVCWHPVLVSSVSGFCFGVVRCLACFEPVKGPEAHVSEGGF